MKKNVIKNLTILNKQFVNAAKYRCNSNKCFQTNEIFSFKHGIGPEQGQIIGLVSKYLTFFFFLVPQ